MAPTIPARPNKVAAQGQACCTGAEVQRRRKCVQRGSRGMRANRAPSSRLRPVRAGCEPVRASCGRFEQAAGRFEQGAHAGKARCLRELCGWPTGEARRHLVRRRRGLPPVARPVWHVGGGRAFLRAATAAAAAAAIGGQTARVGETRVTLQVGSIGARAARVTRASARACTRTHPHTIHTSTQTHTQTLSRSHTDTSTRACARAHTKTQT
eukprot:1146461-Pleurochrysis_carterae.AAC.1